MTRFTIEIDVEEQNDFAMQKEIEHFLMNFRTEDLRHDFALHRNLPENTESEL